jgi:hypothetical protein
VLGKVRETSNLSLGQSSIARYSHKAAHRRTHTQVALARTHIYKIIPSYPCPAPKIRDAAPRLPDHYFALPAPLQRKALIRQGHCSASVSLRRLSTKPACQRHWRGGQGICAAERRPSLFVSPGHPPVQLLRTPHLVLAGPRKAALARNTRFRRSSSASSTLCSVIGRVCSLGRLPESPPDIDAATRQSLHLWSADR